MDPSAPTRRDDAHEPSRTAPPAGKYYDWGERFPFKLPDRTWPDKVITQAPNWCSVDLRDVNQALPHPFTVDEKVFLFDLLANKIGFREIEVGYPTSSEEEFTFLRRLIEENRIPDHVVPQILTMSRSDLFAKAFESLRGARSAIFHVYCPVSDDQLNHFFKMSRYQILQKVIDDVTEVRKQAAQADFDVHLQFSPESATCGDVAFTKAVLQEVYRIWQPSKSRRLIFNIPDTVQVASGQGSHNRYADIIESICRQFPKGDVEISLHTHNDQLLGVAAAINGLLAGASRVEGAFFFGHGERTGNCDLLVMAKYLFEMGIDPKIFIKDIPFIREIVERVTRMPVHPRHPLGDLAFTAFSGGHQAAIAAGLAHQEAHPEGRWEVPYLTVDPKDFRLAYTPIRLNSQSGKHGAAFCLKENFGCDIPRAMLNEWSQAIKNWCDVHKDEIKPQQLWELFESSYIKPAGPLEFKGCTTTSDGDRTKAHVELKINGENLTVSGSGNGPIDAATRALGEIGQSVLVKSFTEHSRGEGSDAEAVAYVQVERDGKTTFGVGIASNIEQASLKALVAGVNRLAWSEA